MFYVNSRTFNLVQNSKVDPLPQLEFNISKPNSSFPHFKVYEVKSLYQTPQIYFLVQFRSQKGTSTRKYLVNDTNIMPIVKTENFALAPQSCPLTFFAVVAVYCVVARKLTVTVIRIELGQLEGVKQEYKNRQILKNPSVGKELCRCSSLPVRNRCNQPTTIGCSRLQSFITSLHGLL